MFTGIKSGFKKVLLVKATDVCQQNRNGRVVI